MDHTTPHDPHRPPPSRRSVASTAEDGPPGWRDRMLRLGLAPGELPSYAAEWVALPDEVRGVATAMWEEASDLTIVARIAASRAAERAEVDGVEDDSPYLAATLNEAVGVLRRLDDYGSDEEAMAALVAVLEEDGQVEVDDGDALPDVRPFADVITDRANADGVDRDVALERAVADATVFHSDDKGIALSRAVDHLSDLTGVDDSVLWQHLHGQVTTDDYEPRWLAVLADGSVTDLTLHDGPHKVATYEHMRADGVDHDAASIAVWGDPTAKGGPEQLPEVEQEGDMAPEPHHLAADVPEGHVRVSFAWQSPDGNEGYTATGDVPEDHEQALAYLTDPDRPDTESTARLVLAAELTRPPSKRRKSILTAVTEVLGGEETEQRITDADAPPPPAPTEGVTQ